MREDIYYRGAEVSLDNLRAALAVQASTLAATVGSDRDSITGPSPHRHSPRTVMLIWLLFSPPRTGPPRRTYLGVPVANDSVGVDLPLP